MVNEGDGIMTNAAATLRLNSNISIVGNGIGISIILFTCALTIGYLAASLLGPDFAVTLPLGSFSQCASLLLFILSGLILRAGFKGSNKQVISISALAGLVLGSFAYVALI